MKRKLRSRNMKFLSSIFRDCGFNYMFDGQVPVFERHNDRKHMTLKSTTVEYYDTLLFWGGSYVEYTYVEYPNKSKSGFKPQHFWTSWISFDGERSTVKHRREKLEIYIHEEKTPY